ncbi:Protein REVEILLE 8 [Camellia lanceoleosa]|uniref:Protein REVEILLE 8 n=1 Tax=Camellia lanceoleosa TaxID=1840588 RepID=A0ACC0G5Y4_9ERIC|nr:Protein REVEILLE 8 [Camellia lanceoleosa]
MVKKNGTIEHVPPPRPKHKAARPCPQKAPKNVLAPFQAFMAYPSSSNSLALGYSPWDDTSMLIHSPSGGIMLSQNESTYVLSSSSWQRISWSRRSKGVSKD